MDHKSFHLCPECKFLYASPSPEGQSEVCLCGSAMTEIDRAKYNSQRKLKWRNKLWFKTISKKGEAK